LGGGAGLPPEVVVMADEQKPAMDLPTALCLPAGLALWWGLAALPGWLCPRAEGAPVPPLVWLAEAAQNSTVPPAPPRGCYRWGAAYLVECRPDGYWHACTPDGRQRWAGRWRVKGDTLWYDEALIDPDTHRADWPCRGGTPWPNPSWEPFPGPMPPVPVAGRAAVQ
jgi:hypothetical protein